MTRCEMCEEVIVGAVIVHPEEGDSYCARCVVELLGAEREWLRRALEELREWLATQERLKGGPYVSAEDVRSRWVDPMLARLLVEGTRDRPRDRRRTARGQ